MIKTDKNQLALLEKCIKNSHDKALNFMVARTKDRELSEDILQDAYVRILNSNSTIIERAFLSFLIQISVNLHTDYHRRAAKLPFRAVGAHHGKVSMTDEVVLNFKLYTYQSDNNVERERIEFIESEIKKLNTDRQNVINLRLTGLRFQEISNITGINHNTCRGYMARFEKTMQRKISEDKNLEHLKY